MKWIAILGFLLVLPKSVYAHHDIYHNYAGSGYGFFVLLVLLIAALVVYGRVKGVFGRGVLVSAILISFFVTIFYPHTPLIGSLGQMIISFLVVFSFATSYLYEKFQR